MKMAEETNNHQSSVEVGGDDNNIPNASFDNDDTSTARSVDSNYDNIEDTPSSGLILQTTNSFSKENTIEVCCRSPNSIFKQKKNDTNPKHPPKRYATLEYLDYDAATIRAEFQTYKHILPHPDTLLQQQHSFQMIRSLIESHNLPVPRFLQYNFEQGIKPHHALCCLLLTEYHEGLRSASSASIEQPQTQTNRTVNNGNDDNNDNDNAVLVMESQEEKDPIPDEQDELPEKKNNKKKKKQKKPATTPQQNNHPHPCSYWWIRMISFGYLYPQHNNPAEFIRDQFNRVADVVPLLVITAHDLRKKIRNRGLPVPNYFLDPESDTQFPPHIALLVILQDGEAVSAKFRSIVYRVAFSLFAMLVLLLRVVLEVIGGAGAIWGGAEVMTWRQDNQSIFWRYVSVAVGVLCLFRFITLNVPHHEDDDGAILGPAGPWSLRIPLRMRAVAEHPFHYFFRAVPPFQYSQNQDNHNNNPKKKN